VPSSGSTSSSAVGTAAQTYQPTPVAAASSSGASQAVSPPPYTQSSAQQVNLSQIEKQQQELDRRAAELDRRERMLNTTAPSKRLDFLLFLLLLLLKKKTYSNHSYYCYCCSYHYHLDYFFFKSQKFSANAQMVSRSAAALLLSGHKFGNTSRVSKMGPSSLLFVAM
jgi:hypothetical protein